MFHTLSPGTAHSAAASDGTLMQNIQGVVVTHAMTQERVHIRNGSGLRAHPALATFMADRVARAYGTDHDTRHAGTPLRKAV